MTLKAPILFDLVIDFVKDVPEAIEVLSKKYQIEWALISNIGGVEMTMIQANQFYKFRTVFPHVQT